MLSPPTSPATPRLNISQNSNGGDLISFDEDEPGRELNNISVDHFDPDRIVTLVMFENMVEESGKLSFHEAQKLVGPHFQL